MHRTRLPKGRGLGRWLSKGTQWIDRQQEDSMGRDAGVGINFQNNIFPRNYVFRSVLKDNVCKPPLLLEWWIGRGPKLFVKNCMKCADLHGKVMFSNTQPHGCCVGRIPKIDSSWELNEMSRYAQTCHVLTLTPLWGGGEESSLKLYGARYCVKCTDLHRKVTFPMLHTLGKIQNIFFARNCMKCAYLHRRP